MKKIIYTLLSLVFLLTFSSATTVNTNTLPMEIISTQMSTTEIFNYLNTNLGLTATQKPVVKKAVDEAGVETTKLNSDATKSAEETKIAKTSIVNSLVKKLSSGVLTAAQSKKLTGLTSTLTTMFAQLK